MTGIVNAPSKTFPNLIWLWSESSLILGEFFSPPFKCIEPDFDSCQTGTSMLSNGGEKNWPKINKDNKTKFAKVLEGALTIKNKLEKTQNKVKFG